MPERLRDPLALTPDQLRQLREVTANGTANFHEGYRLIHGWIAGHPAAREDGTAFWFEQAAGINQDSSLSANFIRRHTEIGLDLARVPLEERKPMQELSDMIARDVTGEMLEFGRVDPLAMILAKDIQVALKNGQVELWGWGGSFYYYDQPYTPNIDKGFPHDPDGSFVTIGETIERDGNSPLLVETSARTLKAMVVHGEIRAQDIDQVMHTSWNAGMPAGMKAEVVLRSSELLVEHTRDRAMDRAAQAHEQVEQLPGDVLDLLETQRDRLLQQAPERLYDLLHRQLPSIPRLGAALSADDAERLRALTAQADAHLQRGPAADQFARAVPATRAQPPADQGFAHRTGYSPQATHAAQAPATQVAAHSPLAATDPAQHATQQALQQQVHEQFVRQQARQQEDHDTLERDSHQAGAERPNPYEQDALGQRLNRFFDAAARGDEQELDRLAEEHARTPEFQEWDRWGQESFRQWEQQQAQIAMQEQQQSRGRSI